MLTYQIKIPGYRCRLRGPYQRRLGGRQRGAGREIERATTELPFEQ